MGGEDGCVVGFHGAYNSTGVGEMRFLAIMGAFMGIRNLITCTSAHSDPTRANTPARHAPAALQNQGMQVQSQGDERVGEFRSQECLQNRCPLVVTQPL